MRLVKEKSYKKPFHNEMKISMHKDDKAGDTRLTVRWANGREENFHYNPEHVAEAHSNYNRLDEAMRVEYHGSLGDLMLLVARLHENDDSRAS